ncbi:antibiotic biosynthesis monooxygenase [Halopseudomonas sp. SMJS2]|uniref:antibiotic biosynthesis monooxygenase n=1 Tax=Halopseudomonas sp. SMJS2 TaxID=3041098 RepID=UPI0004531FE3|nr:antibiotic biosynthesis monooxygenase [Halopseudomonas sp. SMJS2]EZQ17305.1 antibiotic biosynthesis monooxygenase [Halopseudomonas bauzanensis]WGK62843.1 antibiotic biosynthesis monooxygenase [Halopseudomonas sp. SMJS2]
MVQQLPEIVTLVVRHRVRPAQLTAYEAWLRRTIGVADQFEGHLGVNVARSRDAGLTSFTIVLRFRGPQRLQAWLESHERKQLINEALPLLVEGDQTEVTAVKDFWFIPADSNAQPPLWKQACVTFLVILPLSLLVPLVWRPLFAGIPWLGGYVASNLVITATIVVLVVYLFMPMVTGWFADWLTDDDGAAS